MQRVAQRARRRQQKETSESATDAAGVALAGERNERFSERRGGQDVEKRKKRAIQPAARRACRRRETGTSDSASGAAGKESKRERNEPFSERHGGSVVTGRGELAIQPAARRVRRGKEKETSNSTSGTVGVSSPGVRNEQFIEPRCEGFVAGSKERAIQRVALRVRRRQQKATSDTASGTAGVSSAGERNLRFSKQHGVRDVRGTKKQPIQ
jgi:hypothetical protein